MKKVIGVTLRIILWLLAGIIILGITLVLVIHIPAVQDFGRKKVVSYLHEKLQTDVAIGYVRLRLPNTLLLEEVYLEDQQNDTLLSAGQLFVDISLFRLFRNEVKLNEIRVEKFYSNIHRRADSTFNFDFVTDAFVTEETPPELQDTSAAPMVISLDQIILDDIRLDYRDETLSSTAAVSLNHFQTRFNESDLENLRFGARQTETDGLYLNYQDGSGGLEALLRLGRLNLSAFHLDLMKQLVDLETVELDSTRAVVAFNQLSSTETNSPAVRPGEDNPFAADSVPRPPDSTGLEGGWQARVDQLLVSHTAFQFDDHNVPRQAEGLDYMHLKLDDFGLDLQDFNYSANAISGSLKSASFREQSGFSLKTLRTDFTYSGTGAALDELYLETDGSRLQKMIRISYPSLEEVAEDPGVLSLEADLPDCRLSYADMRLLAPFLAEYEPFKSASTDYVAIDGRAKGPLNDLVIEHLELATLDQTYLAANAHLQGLPDIEKAWFDVDVQEVRSGSADINRLAGPGMIPASLRLPALISAKAVFQGNLDDFTTQASVQSSFGNMTAKGSMRPGGGAGAEKYQAEFNLIHFDLGQLLRQEDSLGRASFVARLEGAGTTVETADARLDAILQELEYSGYAYRNLELSGTIRNQQLQALAQMKDPNLHFNLNTSADLSGAYPAVKLNLQLDTLDLQALHLAKNEMRLRMDLVADLATADPDYLNGWVSVHDVALRLDSGAYQLDTIAIRASASDTLKTLNVQSEFMQATLAGNFTTGGLAPAIQAHLNKYFNATAADSAEVVENAADTTQQVTLTARLFQPPVLEELLPELSRLDTVCIDAHFDNRVDAFQVYATAPAIRYGSNEVDSVLLAINSQDTSIHYHLGIERFYNPAIQVLHTRVDGQLAGDSATIELLTHDADMKPRYRLGGALTMTNQYVFRFDPETLLLDYEAWAIEPDNGFYLSDSGFYARNIRFSNEGQYLLVNSETYQPGAPLGIEFGDFELSTVTRIAQQDSLAIGGQLNGTALISGFDTTLAVVADLLVEQFSFRSDTVGDITLRMNNEEENAYALDVSIKSDRNQAYLAGYFYPEPVAGQNLDLSLDILNLDMVTVQAFSFGQIHDASGSLKGSFNITGTTSQPKILGGLAFKEVGLTPTYINSPLYFEDELIGFTDEGIAFSQFTILDSMKNSAVLDGLIRTTDFVNYGFDLQFETSNFRAINNQPGDNELFYGQLFLDSEITVRGTLDNPEVDAYVRVNEKTDLTLLLPSSEPGLQEREGVVEFVDMDAPPAPPPPDTVASDAGITGLNLSADVEVDEKARFTVIVDPVNGDNLQIRGSAALSTNMDPNGTINLTGRYEISEGAYELSFNLLRRRFEISEGSYITWVGDPLSADVDITAVYVAETAPMELVQDQLTSLSQSERNTFKQTLPFQVELHMEGELMKPEISFDIDLPEKEREAHDGLVYARLQQLRLQESDLNKQVFALLVLNRFVAENPFESQGGSSVSSMARQSVSKLLSAQLNRLAGDLIAGVDLNFDLESTEDYSTGEKVDRTDLNVGLSKSLLNDRITVNVGSSFGLEGQETRGQASTIAGDVSVDYRLSKDGRYLLRAYRQNEYEGVIEGQIIETGLSFIIALDYDEFKELFKK